MSNPYQSPQAEDRSFTTLWCFSSALLKPNQLLLRALDQNDWLQGWDISGYQFHPQILSLLIFCYHLFLNSDFFSPLFLSSPNYLWFLHNFCTINCLSPHYSSLATQIYAPEPSEISVPLCTHLPLLKVLSLLHCHKQTFLSHNATVSSAGSLLALISHLWAWRQHCFPPRSSVFLHLYVTTHSLFSESLSSSWLLSSADIWVTPPFLWGFAI